MIHLAIITFLVANLTLPTNTAVSSIGGLFSYGNTILGGILGLGFFVATILIATLGALATGNALGPAITWGGFLSILVGLILVGLTVLNPAFLLGSLALIIIGGWLGMGNNSSRPY